MKLFHVVGQTSIDGVWVKFHSRPVPKRLAKKHLSKFESSKLATRHRKVKVVRVRGTFTAWPTLETATRLEANNKRLGKLS